MTRSMGDAMGGAVSSLVAQNPDVFAIYVTGSPGIVWTAAERAQIPAGKTVVTIDQGFTGSPVMDAIVRDVESGAWTMSAAVNRAGWTVIRPTLYFSESLMVRRFMTARERRDRVALRLAGAYSAGWRGDVWVALYDNIPEVNFPVPPGINVVAKQYTDTAQGGNVDLSVIFDPYWPLLGPDPKPAKREAEMIIWIPEGAAIAAGAYLLSGGRLHKIADGAAVALYEAAQVNVAGSPTGPRVSVAEANSLAADFPAGNPAVTVNTPTVTLPTFQITGSATPT